MRWKFFGGWVFNVVLICMIGRFLLPVEISWPLIALGFIFSLLIADMGTGVIHFIGDYPKEWRNSFLRKFHTESVKHHENPSENCDRKPHELPSLSPTLQLIPILIISSITLIANSFYFFLFMIFSLCWIWLALWAHLQMHRTHPSKILTFLQKIKLIMPTAQHFAHHAPPHNKNYCSLNSWSERILVKLRMYNLLGKALHHLNL